jgi:hypothetical protein
MQRTDLLIAGFSMALPVAALQAQWIAVRLHPEGATYSRVYALATAYQGGTVDTRATLWTGQGLTNLGPSQVGEVYGISGTHQAGHIAGLACLWSGTPESRINLNPSPNAISVALAVCGEEQVGLVSFGQSHAALWHGTAASWVDLNPAGAEWSRATGTDGEYQSGYAGFPGGYVTAALWHGSAASFVNLNPGAPYGPSEIYGAGPGQQVGVADGQGISHAALWSGSAASFVSLHPPAYGVSVAYATNGSVQAGYATTQGAHAGIWFGTPDSFLDLHQYLPTNYSSSVAYAVHQEGDTIYVGGFARQSLGGAEEAFMWVGTAPGACYPNCDQSTGSPRLNVLDFACFLNRFTSGDPYANCDGSTRAPALNVLDFNCFINRFTAGCP